MFYVFWCFYYISFFNVCYAIATVSHPQMSSASFLYLLNWVWDWNRNGKNDLTYPTGGGKHSIEWEQRECYRPSLPRPYLLMILFGIGQPPAEDRNLSTTPPPRWQTTSPPPAEDRNLSHHPTTRPRTDKLSHPPPQDRQPLPPTPRLRTYNL